MLTSVPQAGLELCILLPEEACAIVCPGALQQSRRWVGHDREVEWSVGEMRWDP